MYITASLTGINIYSVPLIKEGDQFRFDTGIFLTIDVTTDNIYNL